MTKAQVAALLLVGAGAGVTGLKAVEHGMSAEAAPRRFQTASVRVARFVSDGGTRSPVYVAAHCDYEAGDAGTGRDVCVKAAELTKAQAAAFEGFLSTLQIAAPRGP